ncbi:MAG: MBL fold metallo-hydrolase [Candidatus Aminicenantia bacterium]
MIENIIVQVGAFETNCYVVFNQNGSAIIIDPGGEPDKIIEIIQKEKLKPLKIVNTHGHADHCGGNKALKKKYSIPILMHKDDLEILHSFQNNLLFPLVKGSPSPEPDYFLEEGDLVDLEDISFRVIHTPGHTPGGISLYYNGLIFSGDTIFSGSVGRTDFPGGSWETLINSIKNKILIFPDKTLILPGHGPSTTVGGEKRNNPFIRYEEY